MQQGEAHKVINALQQRVLRQRLYLEIADALKNYAAISLEGEVTKNRAERRRLEIEAMGREQHRRNERRTRRDAERGFKGRGKEE